MSVLDLGQTLFPARGGAAGLGGGDGDGLRGGSGDSGECRLQLNVEISKRKAAVGS